VDEKRKMHAFYMKLTSQGEKVVDICYLIAATQLIHQIKSLILPGSKVCNGRGQKPREFHC
jgi:hypothetical protein